MREPRASSGPSGPSSRAARWLGWITSSTTFYLVAFLMGTLMVLSLFNPHWGAIARAWPHEVFASDGTWVWGTVQAQAAATLLILALLILALLLPKGRTRGVLAVFAAGIGMVAFQAGSTLLASWVLPLATALVGGTLLVRSQDAGRSQRAVLLVALAVLAANLFLPWDPETIEQRELKPGYHSTATVQIDMLLSPPEELMTDFGDGDEATRVPAKGYARILLLSVPQTIGLLMLLVGLVGLAGFGGGWARWVAGSALLILTFGSAWVLYHYGSLRLLMGGPEPWELGLEFWAKTWKNHGAAWALPLAGGLAEIVRRRVG